MYPRQAIPSTTLTYQLNDHGARCIQAERYDQAISTLIRALKLWEHISGVLDIESNCFIDECIVNARQEIPSQHGPLSPDCQATHNEAVHSEGRFIYRQPIFASPDVQKDDASPTGNTLSLIIILNLAIAHHLHAIQQGNCRRLLQKALQLYELAHQLQIEEQICSPRATMIVANNVGEIHLAVNNISKHTRCLKHLLSTMMYVIDCRVPLSSVELDGFFRNTAELILRSDCAGAA